MLYILVLIAGLMNAAIWGRKMRRYLAMRRMQQAVARGKGWQI